MLVQELRTNRLLKLFFKAALSITIGFLLFIVLDGAFASRYNMKYEDIVVFDAPPYVRMLCGISSVILFILWIVVHTQEKIIDLTITDSGISEGGKLRLDFNKVKYFNISLFLEHRKVYKFVAQHDQDVTRILVVLNQDQKAKLFELIGNEKFKPVGLT